MKTENKKVYVALSGGVDSSVALLLLRNQGYNVTGVYFKTYKPDGDRTYCKEQGKMAQKICELLGVPFKVFDLQTEYKERVFDYMIKAYSEGRTPNPDIICNKEIKFGLFAEHSFKQGADYIATGHYARLTHDKCTHLVQALDTNKDQTYFLSQVKQDVLDKTIFPIGDFVKSQVREIAKNSNLPTYDKPDSQGICFIGHEIEVKDFLKKYIKHKPGKVYDLRGNEIGTHIGVRLLTIGERKGFKINPEYQRPDMPRLFIIKRDIKNNSIVVGTRTELEFETGLQKELTITGLNWICGLPDGNTEYTCRIRHRGALYPCKIVDIGVDSVEIKFINEVPYAPASGQFLALYKGDECLGGGVIS